MRKLEISLSENERLSFGIDIFKIIYCDEFKKYRIIQTFRSAFLLKEQSEYALEKRECSNLSINNQEINLRKSKFYYINCCYDIEKETKLQRNSLLLDFINIRLKDIEFNDEFNTVKMMYSDLASVINEYLKINLEINLEVEMNSLDINTIPKFLEPYFFKNAFKINSTNLSYEESILLQLELLDGVLSEPLEKEVFVVLDISVLTSSILSKLNNIKNPSCNIVLFTDELPQTAMSNVYICQKQSIDLADDNDIYYKITQKIDCLTSLGETKEALMNYLNNINDDKTAKISRII